eukprot:TRINITY_DN754_c0_g1_i2.p2 TRINITY_DN754_c0_g1~~TRINITY_DN754_c0_g1_i2.p2  ORF type:complete len:194 (+),score=43.95 TRINITY_DN754_c0_g1_i2:241-822(+)
MPPKRGKGKGKMNPGEERPSPEDELRRAKLKIETLENLLITRSEQASRAMAGQNELRNKVDQYNRDFEMEKTERFEITADMTRQYKAMQEQLIARNNELESKIREWKDQLEAARLALDETRREKDQIIAMKDAEIAEQKQKMEDMSIEFGDMLKETLDKMSERIEMTSSTWEGEAPPANKAKLEEFNLGSVGL